MISWLNHFGGYFSPNSDCVLQIKRLRGKREALTQTAKRKVSAAGLFAAHRLTIGEGLKLLVLTAVVVWGFIQGAQGLNYRFQWYLVPKYLFTFDGNALVVGPLMQGLFVTLKVSAAALVLSFLVGLGTALARMAPTIVLNALARGYLEVIRNTPLLVQLFFIYFVMAPILGIERFAAAVLALSLFEGAYASEIIRAGIVSIHKGQWEAGQSLGFTRFQLYRHIVLPQAIRRMLPPLAGQAISLVKDSALVSTIAIYDLTMRGQAIIAETYLVFELWFTIAAMYMVITLSLSLGVAFLEGYFAERGATK
jgi:polar amino acid transport system permease protein